MLVAPPVWTARGLAALSSPRLAQSAAVLHLCGSRLLVNGAVALLRAASSRPAAGLPLLWAMKQTAFRHFTAGESLADVRAAAATLAPAGVRMIVDHSTEESEAADARQANLRAKVALLGKLRAELAGECVFVPIKLTALASPTLLERLTAATLTAAEEGELEEGLALLRALAAAAREEGISLLLDAEQTHRQPGITLLARLLASEFNAPGAERPVVYHTVQAYLRSAEHEVEAELEAARGGGYSFAAKLVRGAYRHTELSRAPAALQPSKSHTDAAYDTLDALKLPRSDPCVHLAQIQGMADDLTLTLGLMGYNALKLMPYGHFDEVLPWLLRRLEENQDALGAAGEERPLLRHEMRRRLLGSSAA
ncbi:proline dehydrogenase [Emiliania huxleyi CCMP1516]|uniref:Proline dehydrogenase n=2 Tax=Emiliania huxleyi TaxID=2903 RepID=A0A0D3J5T9_EMIH1|nr:proline dehydrogenase [Emiliania huxleyi CCMP1516]EOD18874.1 proline dehydrogenase [Emiliania huxleyi CCMP1516]|eukprot:XP_005771303.1 proline dehydrogenase [Emiliania huxleyi CCMP1516]